MTEDLLLLPRGIKSGSSSGKIATLKHEKSNESTPNQVTENPDSGTTAEASSNENSSGSGEMNALQETLLKLEAERDSYKDQLLRSLADFQNYRKRVEADKQALRTSAKESVVLDLIGVLDNFERTITAVDSGATLESVIEGIKLIERQLRQMLEQHGVKKIDSHGRPFDPELHEAISVEVSEEHDENTVTAELASGYKLADKVIRPARVKVSKKS